MGMTNARLALGVAALAALLLAPHAGARPAPSGVSAGFIDDDAGDCTEAVPAQYAQPGGDPADQEEIVLDLHVVLDEVTLPDAQAIIERASKPYREIAIRVAPTYEEVTFEATGATAGGVPTIDAQALIDQTRAHFGGYRPHNADVVYTLTGKEITSAGAFGDAVAGMADCIGGIRYPDAAFAVGEADVAGTPHGRPGGKIAGHEVAHLLGAHHHYANCAEGDPAEATTYGTPCTLMFNDTFLISMRFSTLEAAVVRGHAAEWASKTPAGPPPVGERTIEAKRVRRWLGGDVLSGAAASCFQRVPVEVQRKQGRHWTSYYTTTTDLDGAFEVEVLDRGAFRALAPSVEAHDGKSWTTCAEVTSAPVRF